jgi:dTDP-4-dehydrorhamnose 3,5-epimerase-like enzyme
MIKVNKMPFCNADDRGSLVSVYRKEDSELDFVEDRVSQSSQGVVRGFHGDNTTWKYCACLYGRLYLVTFDLETETTERHTISKNDVVLIPPNHLNAHQCLTGKCILFYKWTEYYKGPENQWSINYNDSFINPRWPLKPTKVSSRDLNAPFYKESKLCDSENLATLSVT